jgi:hypothetical protein
LLAILLGLLVAMAQGGKNEPSCASCSGGGCDECTGRVQKAVDKIDSGGRVSLAGNDATQPCGCATGGHRRGCSAG